MIKGIEIENVRLFEGAGWSFPLSGLTVFCGTNSSGKSTLLKLFLLLRQSMGIYESYESESGRLRFVGSQVDLGGFYTIVSNNDYSRDVAITLTTEVAWLAAVANRLRSLMEPVKESEAAVSQEPIEYHLKAAFRFGAVSSGKLPAQDAVESINDFEGTLTPEPKGFLKHSLYELNVSGKTLFSWEVVCSEDESSDPSYSVLIPENYFSAERLPKIEVDREFKKGYVRVGVILDGILPRGLIAKLLPEEGEPLADEEARRVVGPLPSVMFNMVNQLRRELMDVEYIGPLRSPAKRYYLTPTDVSPLMDPAGEFLPFILRNVGRYEAWCIRPGSESEPRREPLFSALNAWMHYIRTGREFPEEVRDKEIDCDTTRVLVEIKVKSVLGGGLYALADSGFGYSQLLPIIVRGLIAEEGHTLIVEQPELHLNPAVQLRLAEFLVAMARSGKQVFIETHSEHIVNTIRVLSAEDESGELASMCTIYYVDVEGNRPFIHELSIQRDGTVPDWPQPFFGEAASLTGRLLRAQKRLRTGTKKE